MWKIHSKYDDKTEVIKEFTVGDDTMTYVDSLLEIPTLMWVKVYKDGKRVSSISFQ